MTITLPLVAIVALAVLVFGIGVLAGWRHGGPWRW